MDARIDHVTDSRDGRPSFSILYRRWSDTRSSHIVIQADNGDHAMQALTQHIGNPHYSVTSIRELERLHGVPTPKPETAPKQTTKTENAQMKHTFTANEIAARPVVRFTAGHLSSHTDWTGTVVGYEEASDTYVIVLDAPEYQDRGEVKIRYARADVELTEVTAPDPEAEPRDIPNAAYLAARVIAAAREAYGSTGGFDDYTALYGVERYGEIWNQCMILAREWVPAAPVNDDDAYEAWSTVWRSKSQAVWQTIESELREYELRCNRDANRRLEAALQTNDVRRASESPRRRA